MPMKKGNNTNMIKRLIKNVLIRIDDKLNTSLYKKAGVLLNQWDSAHFLNALRRTAWYKIIKWRYRLMRSQKLQFLNLHLGCGNTHLENHINIDWRKTSATDVVCDIRRLPYPDDSVSLIATYHVIEHLSRHDLPRALKDWHRVLSPGGKLVIEYPDFDELVKKYLDGDERQLDGIFALQRFQGDYHLFGYNFKRLKRLLESSGFTDIRQEDPQDYHAIIEEWPCIRIECAKRDIISQTKKMLRGPSFQ
jgi:predicted SAM-dependent methyltransferase